MELATELAVSHDPGSVSVSDFWVRFKGNATFVDNTFKWLIDEEDIAVAVEEIAGEDRPVQHSQGSYTFIFLATIFLVPVAVMACGFFVVGSGRRRST